MEFDRMQSVVDVHVLFADLQNRYLFLKRANTGYKDGHYSLVAGHLETNESIKQCAIRESKEEAGVDITEDDLDLALVMRRDAEQNRISFFLRCRVWSGSLRNCEPQKCSEFTWAAPDSLPDPMVDYVAAAMKEIGKGALLADYRERSQ